MTLKDELAIPASYIVVWLHRNMGKIHRKIVDLGLTQSYSKVFSQGTNLSNSLLCPVNSKLC